MSFFEPSPVLLAFIFVQRFVFFEVLGVLALLRLIVGAGLARLSALIVTVICGIAIAATFAPALNMTSVPFYPEAARLLAMGGGTTLPVIASAIFATCMLIPARRWRWIDIVHGIGVLAYLGLWVATRL